MKKNQKQTVVKSIVSLFTLGIFLLIAVGSMNEKWIKTTEFDGTYFIEKGEQWEYIDEDSPMYPTGRCYMKI
ncbi:MAG: hypothetical protein K9H26_09120 [Prolixibacteraceae bacterium]|nr:hypothetical protein [Prolixibacteraceae bacterium]